MWKKAAMAAIAVLAMAAAYVRPVYSVTIGPETIPGDWDRRSLAEAQALAGAAADEVARSDADEPELELAMHLTLGPVETDSGALARELLAGYDGVQRAYRVSVDGIDIGVTKDVSALDEVVLAYIAQYTPADCVSAGLDSEIELEEVYIPSGTADDVMEISARLRDLTRVSYITSSGERVYA